MMNDMPPPFDSIWFRFVMGGVIGGVLGSFATMLAYRLPRRLSILFPGSACPSCHTPLRVRDLVPVLSWLALRGRCRHCGARIGRQYLYIEMGFCLFGGILAALL